MCIVQRYLTQLSDGYGNTFTRTTADLSQNEKRHVYVSIVRSSDVSK